MQAGLLTGSFTAERAAQLSQNDWRSRHPMFQEPQLSVNLRLVDGLRPIAARLGMTVSQLVLAWALRLPEMTAAIAGARSAAQIQETVKAGEVTLASEVVREIEGLLQDRADSGF
jgi:aryl-alcohol dehydrogenase-like predicted oxidoreductase